MTTDFLHYLLNVSVIWAVLLTFYAFTQRDNGNWMLRRRLLLGSYLLGFLLPLLPAVSVPEVVQSFSISRRLIVNNSLIEPVVDSTAYFSWSTLCLFLYFNVAAFMGVSKVRLLVRSLYWKYTKTTYAS
jgi:hypothetical protein